MERVKSQEAYAEAIKIIPGGVNSPVRALRSVGEIPLFIKKANGTILTDVDNNQLIDFCLSWGVFILGHSHPQVNEAVKRAVDNGSSYGIPSLQETALARLVVDSFPSIEKVRFVNSGTEAVMSAVRVARGFTGRNIIVKFDGCYHGHADHLLVSAGSGVTNIGNSSSSGVPADFTKYTVSLPYNDQDAVQAYFNQNGDKIAAVIIEPIACNMGVVLPKNSFLKFLREITSKQGALLIFDEVITGFRLSLGGAQGRLNVIPDLTTIGKIVGGGFPAAAFGGRTDIMSTLAPDGSVYQAGTLSGNPVAMTAGIETVRILQQEHFYSELEIKSEWFIHELKDEIKGKDIQLNHIGSMFTLFFNEQPVHNFADAKRSNQQRFAQYFRSMFARGIYVSPSQFEGNFISKAHSKEQLEQALYAISEILKKI